MASEEEKKMEYILGRADPQLAGKGRRLLEGGNAREVYARIEREYRTVLPTLYDALQGFYQNVVGKRRQDVTSVLDTWRGSEADLIVALSAKYKSDYFYERYPRLLQHLDVSSNTKARTPKEGRMPQHVKIQILDMFSSKAPHKLPEVKRLLRKHDGKGGPLLLSKLKSCWEKDYVTVTKLADTFMNTPDSDITRELDAEQAELLSSLKTLVSPKGTRALSPARRDASEYFNSARTTLERQNTDLRNELAVVNKENATLKATLKAVKKNYIANSNQKYHHLRREPSLNARMLGELTPGEMVEVSTVVSTESGSWGVIEGREGWALMKGVDNVEYFQVVDDKHRGFGQIQSHNTQQPKGGSRSRSKSPIPSPYKHSPTFAESPKRRQYLPIPSPIFHVNTPVYSDQTPPLPMPFTPVPLMPPTPIPIPAPPAATQITPSTVQPAPSPSPNYVLQSDITKINAMLTPDVISEANTAQRSTSQLSESLPAESEIRAPSAASSHPLSRASRKSHPLKRKVTEDNLDEFINSCMKDSPGPLVESRPSSKDQQAPVLLKSVQATPIVSTLLQSQPPTPAQEAVQPAPASSEPQLMQKVSQNGVVPCTPHSTPVQGMLQSTQVSFAQAPEQLLQPHNKVSVRGTEGPRFNSHPVTAKPIAMSDALQQLVQPVLYDSRGPLAQSTNSHPLMASHKGDSRSPEDLPISVVGPTQEESITRQPTPLTQSPQAMPLSTQEQLVQNASKLWHPSRPQSQQPPSVQQVSSEQPLQKLQELQRVPTQQQSLPVQFSLMSAPQPLQQPPKSAPQPSQQPPKSGNTVISVQQSQPIQQVSLANEVAVQRQQTSQVEPVSQLQPASQAIPTDDPVHPLQSISVKQSSIVHNDSLVRSVPPQQPLVQQTDTMQQQSLPVQQTSVVQSIPAPAALTSLPVKQASVTDPVQELQLPVRQSAPVQQQKSAVQQSVQSAVPVQLSFPTKRASVPAPLSVVQQPSQDPSEAQPSAPAQQRSFPVQPTSNAHQSQPLPVTPTFSAKHSVASEQPLHQLSVPVSAKVSQPMHRLSAPFEPPVQTQAMSAFGQPLDKVSSGQQFSRAPHNSGALSDKSLSVAQAPPSEAQPGQVPNFGAPFRAPSAPPSGQSVRPQPPSQPRYERSYNVATFVEASERCRCLC